MTSTLAATEAPSQVVPLTVEQYHEMIEHGILEEGMAVELLNGTLVRKDRRDHGGSFMTVGKRHRRAVVWLQQALQKQAERHGVAIECWAQQPITIAEHHEPEPDIAVIACGPEMRFEKDYARPEDVLLLAEVAWASLPSDRGQKLRIFASAGIPEYWIVNLRDNVVEVHREPVPAEERYAQRQVFSPGQAIPFTLSSVPLSVNVDDFLAVPAGDT